MYTPEERAAVSDRTIEIASAHRDVVAGAVIGSLAFGDGDRWSDLDLTFAISDEASAAGVLDEWTGELAQTLDAVALFDLPSGETLYRVFFLPNGLQLDVSVTPASAFAPGGPKFRLLFGEIARTPPARPHPSPVQELFGWAVAYIREARACIERGRWWQAELSINAVRDNALALACHRRGLPTSFGRGFDELPPEVLERFAAARARSLAPDDLRSALSAAAEELLAESEEVGDAAFKIADGIRQLARPE
jgi:predicted nucleotidyltransferase